MNRLSSFFTGLIVGAAGLYWAMTFHVVRADDGVHVVPKVSAGLGDAYVDIREFGAEQWSEHRSLAAAIVHAEKDELLKESALSNLRHAAQGALESLGLK
jgi:hypothetical protein